MFGGDVREYIPTHMENTLQFYYRDEFLTDGSKLNECVRKITGGMAGHCWAGPMLVMKVEKWVFYIVCEMLIFVEKKKSKWQK